MVYLVILYDHDSHMKVNVADLKAHLSRHLRQLREQGGRIDVCLREETVAYLTAADASPPEKPAEVDPVLKRNLQSKGLVIVSGAATDRPPPPLVVTVAGDGRRNRSSVADLRAEKDW